MFNVSRVTSKNDNIEPIAVQEEIEILAILSREDLPTDQIYQEKIKEISWIYVGSDDGIHWTSNVVRFY